LSFKFAARALLELGKELISSDEVALYELIKNAVDAKSPSIEIDLSVVLAYHNLTAALDDLEEGKNKQDIITRLRARVDPSASSSQSEGFFQLLEEAPSSAKGFRKALLEAYEQYNWIEISDEGHGMSFKELNDVFLTVGTRSRRASNIAGGEFLGDKGVGRLSTMRLGDQLLVTTTRAGDDYFNELSIDWSQFSHDSKLEVSEIEIAPNRGRKKSNPKIQGTTIRISHLVGDWTMDRFAEMLSGKIARMVDPFEKGKGNRLITPRYNGKHLLIPSIPEKLLQAAHATCKAKFEFNSKGEPVLTGVMDYRLRSANRPIHQQGAELLSITQRVFNRRGKRGHAATTAAPLRLRALQELGPFDVEIYWYNRLVVEAVEGLTQKRTETREEIAKWSGGPMLFRRGFRILPYGEPGDDWLELDKNAFGESGFKLNRQQVIGRVRVTAGHAALSEQTNREGLVQSDARDALRIILMSMLHREFRGLINDADDAHQLRVQKDKLAALDVDGTTRSIAQAFKGLEKAGGKEVVPHVQRLRSLVDRLEASCQTVIEAAAAADKKAKSDRDKFVQLAGIGLMTEFIFHELDRAVQHTITLLRDKRGRQNVNLEALEEQLITLQKRVSAFDEFTGERRQTKSAFDVREVIELVIANHSNQFSRHGIKVHFDAPRPLRVRAVKGMVVQILENLVSNSVYWLKTQAGIQAKFSPRLDITLNPVSKTLVVADNGPGVELSRREVIFQPFISSKPLGQGRGLGLYISRDLAQYHGWTLEMDPEPASDRQGRLNKFVLDMDDSDE
jgi:signal transduction histidine kinase